MKFTALVVSLFALAAWADEGEARITQVGLHMQQQQLLSMTMGSRTHEVYVTIESDNPSVELQRIAGVATGYVGGRSATVVTSERICRAPCKEVVAVNDVTDFYVAGDGVPGSGTLDLSHYGDSVNLKVKAGSSGRRFGGIMSLIGGISLVAAGGLFAGLMTMDSSNGDLTSNGMFMTGVITAGIGVLLTALGIFLLPGSGTDVEVEQGGPVPSGVARPAPEGSPVGAMGTSNI
ncbi:MAG: hypothetical protein QM723_27835 [Myxococcaceae bacterium]